MMIKSTSEIFAYIIFEAISGKYPNIDLDVVKHEVITTCKNISKAKTVKSLVKYCNDINGFRDDINNQVIGLTIIDKFEDTKSLKTNPISFLHQIIYAKQLHEMKRTAATVEDFLSDDILTKVSQIDVRFMELESLVKVLAYMPQPTLKVAAYLVAHVYATTIRIHFFKDGNGRAARFTVLYLLKRWRLDFISIPKVRNDSTWKKALFNAIQGDINPFASILETRLKESYQNHE